MIKKKKTTPRGFVGCVGSGTRLPGFESGLCLTKWGNLSHSFPIKMGIIIASISLVTTD